MEIRKATRPAKPRKDRPVKVKPGDFEPLSTKEPQISDPPTQITPNEIGTR